MANSPLPKINTAYILYRGLIDQSNTKLLKASPTLASGDFKVSIDGGAFANLATLPTVTPAAGTAVKISLSAAEMNGDNIQVTCIDASGAEWCDQFINIQTATRGIDDLAFPATSGRSFVVSAGGVVDANIALWLAVAPNALSSGKVDSVAVSRAGTAQAGTATTLTLDAGASAVDSYYNGAGLIITSGANIGVTRTVTGYVGATKVVTFSRALPSAADATPTFIVTDITHILPGTDGKALVSTDTQDLSTTLSVNAKNIAGQAAALDANNLLKVDAEDWKGGVIPAVNVTGVPLVDMKYTLGTISPATAGSVRADAVTGAVGSVTGAVGSVGAGGIAAATFAAGAINAAAIATDAIDADALAADAITEIWNKAMTELASVPGPTGTVIQALEWVFAVARNLRTQDASQELLYKDDGIAVLGTSAKSDSGTLFTRGEYS